MLMLLKPEFLVLHFYYYTLRTFLMVLSVILLSMMMITTLNSKCDKTFDLRLELELASEIVSDWGRIWLADFNSKDIQLVLPDQLNNQRCIQRFFGCFQQGV